VATSAPERLGVRGRWIPILSYAMLIVAFVLDVKTPQTLVIAILLNVPIVFSAFSGSRALTTSLVAVALLANAVAGYANGVEAGRFDPIGVADRFLAALSIVLVGWLGTTLQERARRFGRLAAQEARARREGQLGVAVDRMRASLSYDLVLRAIVREAPALFEGEDARWLGADRAPVLLAHRDSEEVEIEDAPLGPELASLTRRATEDDEVLVLEHGDPVGGLVLDRIGAGAALAIPLADRGTALGVVLVGAHDAAAFDDNARTLARVYARSATAALGQARLFAQLAERNEALSERGAVIRDLVYALSHDLRTPLAALILTFRQAKDGLYGPMPSSYGEILDRSLIATDELQRLAQTLLLVARFESGERQPRREWVAVDELVREVAGELAPIAAARTVQVHVDADTLRVVADRGDLRRAVTNLVANALEHAPAGGAVDVGVHRSGARTVAITVADDGLGVAPDARATLFQRFGEGRGRRGAGSGLGLYIVRRVAEEMGGSVRYEPREPNGSIFTIALPATA
jgi:signal transduction histidine kinase